MAAVCAVTLKTPVLLIHRNVSGILTNRHLLESFVNNTEPKIEVICVSETHIKDSDFCGNSNLYSLPGYVFLQ